MPTYFEATAFAPELEPLPRAFPFWFAALLRPLRGVPADAVDRTTGMYNRAGLFAAVMEQVRSREGAECSAIVLEFRDLPEVREIYGQAVAKKVVAKLVQRVRAVAGFRGMVGRTGPAQFTIVFTGVTQANAAKRLQRVLGSPARVEFDVGDSEIVLVPEYMVDCMEPGGEGIQALYRDMCRELARAQRTEKRRLDHLTNERERHSRPMAVHH